MHPRFEIHIATKKIEFYEIQSDRNIVEIEF